MKNVKTLSAFLFLVFIAIPAWSAADAGLPGEFLEFGAGARPMGMGRAFTGLADDVDSISFNPAGLASYRSSQVTLQEVPLPVDGDHQYIAYSQPLYALGSLGIAIINLDAGDVDRVNSQNIKIGKFGARETGYLIGYGQRMSDKLFIGGTAKMAEKNIDATTKRGFGADVGGLYRWNDRVRFGAMIRNLIPPTYGFSSDDESFPIIFRAGSSVKFLKEHLTTAVDLSKTINQSQSLNWHFGVEGYVINNVFLRFGVDESEVTSGLGLRWKTVQVDYAAGFQDLGIINRMALKLFFGGYDVDVKAKPRVFSPVGLKDKVTFKVSTAHRERIVKWILAIRNNKNEVVKSFQGFNEPPRIIEWDGRDAQGEVVKSGRYTYRMVVNDAKNQSEKTPRRGLKVLAPTPFEIEAR